MVGVLVTHAAVDDPVFENLRLGLRDFGYGEGPDIRMEFVTAAGQLDRLPDLGKTLVHQKVDVIIALNEASTRATRQATSDQQDSYRDGGVRL